MGSTVGGAYDLGAPLHTLVGVRLIDRDVVSDASEGSTQRAAQPAASAGDKNDTS
jgi:hypothetical protein